MPENSNIIGNDENAKKTPKMQNNYEKSLKMLKMQKITYMLIPKKSHIFS